MRRVELSIVMDIDNDDQDEAERIARETANIADAYVVSNKEIEEEKSL